MFIFKLLIAEPSSIYQGADPSGVLRGSFNLWYSTFNYCTDYHLMNSTTIYAYMFTFHSLPFPIFFLSDIRVQN